MCNSQRRHRKDFPFPCLDITPSAPSRGSIRSLSFSDPENFADHKSLRGSGNDALQDAIFGNPKSLRGNSPLGKGKQALDNVAPGLDDDEFSSLQLQGGDITRPIYKWSEDAQSRGRVQRSKSFHLSRPEPEIGRAHV